MPEIRVRKSTNLQEFRLISANNVEIKMDSATRRHSVRKTGATSDFIALCPPIILSERTVGGDHRARRLTRCGRLWRKWLPKAAIHRTDQANFAALSGSVSSRAVEFGMFPPSTPALKLLPRQRGQSRLFAYTASAALRREHVGALRIGTVESFGLRHSRGRSVSLIQCSSVQASVDIGS